MSVDNRKPKQKNISACRKQDEPSRKEMTLYETDLIVLTSMAGHKMQISLLKGQGSINNLCSDIIRARGQQ